MTTAGEVFRLQVLPAGIGDALVLDYGTSDRWHRVLVDGGVSRTAEVLAGFLQPGAGLELAVVTHVDNDHVAGLLRLLERSAPTLQVDDLWFNGFRHLPASPLESMGPPEGERLTALIERTGQPWNTAFGGGAVTTSAGAEPSTVTLPGGLRCTVLSPGAEQLARLRPVWAAAVRDAGLDPAVPVEEGRPTRPTRLERMGGPDVAALAAVRTPTDAAVANGSSIAFLAEWGRHSVLLTGDAHPHVVVAALGRWLGPDAVLEVDVLKLPHHGSKANVTTELLRRVRARTYVFSSSGEGRSRHPDDEAVARVLETAAGPVTLAFNHRNPRTTLWDEPALRAAHGYAAVYPDTPGSTARHGGLDLDLLAGPAAAR